MIPPGKPFSTTDDLITLLGKYVMVTGGTSGIGRECVLALAKKTPSVLVFTGRNRSHATEVMKRINTLSPSTTAHFLPLDHSSMSSVREGITKLNTGLLSRLDVLICQAGTMANPPIRTAEGYDIQFATNHLSHALIVRLLLPTLLKTQSSTKSQVRIVIQTSEAYMLHPAGGIDWSSIKTDSKTTPPAPLPWSSERLLPWGGEWIRFAQSQLANLLMAAELARRYPRLLSVAVMPSAISDTKLIRTRSLPNRLLVKAAEPILPAEVGARSLLWAAASEKYEIVNGGYYQAVAVDGWYVRESKNETLAGQLWDWTNRELD